ncbi:hypothetical protein OsJ_29721 [Oryza sativa Japonica Group]|uniref:AP180 N-terminal homology (ANTH) domain-containing protein n=1 Tax=Oryza sativa subsp. japonica TaxID=39947 RepID=A3BZU4_ORYSJ|nr:hypothetical protein OsJ_29721 [Oryza sativa Japonica Group]
MITNCKLGRRIERARARLSEVQGKPRRERVPHDLQSCTSYGPAAWSAGGFVDGPEAFAAARAKALKSPRRPINDSAPSDGLDVFAATSGPGHRTGWRWMRSLQMGGGVKPELSGAETDERLTGDCKHKGGARKVFYATRRGTRMLNMSDFCDRSRTDAWDFSAFVRTYAAYLDDRLEYRMQAKHGGAAHQGRPLREQLYASPGNRFNYDDFIMRDDEATNAEADKAMALVARETPTSEMTLEQLLAKAQLLLAPHCLLLPVAMVVVVLALEKKLLVVVLGGALVEAGGVGGHQASRGEGIRAVVVGDGEAIGVGRQLRLLPTIEMPMRP